MYRKNYAEHLGINDNEYKDIGVEVKATSNEVTNSSNLIIKVNCPSENQINSLKENTILIGMLNPSKNKGQIDKIINKNIKNFFLNYCHVLRELNQWMYYLLNQTWLDIEL